MGSSMGTSRRITRSISRPFTDLSNIIRPFLHSDRGVSSEKAKQLDRDRRLSGGITSTNFDPDWLPRVELSPEDKEGVLEPTSSDFGLSPSIRSQKNSLEVPTKSHPQPHPYPPPPSSLAASSNGDSASVSTADPRPFSNIVPPPPPTFLNSLGRRVKPALVETCPTPPSTQRHSTDHHRPSSRQRSLSGSGGPGIFDDVFSEIPSPIAPHSPLGGEYSSDEEGRFGITELPESRSETPQLQEENTPYSGRRHSLHFPQLVSTLLQAPPPPVMRPSPYRRESVRPLTPLSHSYSINNPSELSLFSWDLAHLPAPGTPRERPFRVRPRSLFLPTKLLGGGKGSGLYGDKFGPIERKPERSRRTRERWRQFFSSTTWSKLMRPGLDEGGRTKEELDDWVALVYSD